MPSVVSRVVLGSPTVSDPQCEKAFAAALAELARLHASALLLRHAAAAAHDALAEGLGIGDRVRRAARQGESHRPDERDYAALASVVERLGAELARALARPEISELRQALGWGDTQRIAALADAVFAGLQPLPGEQAFGYLPVALRARHRGERILAPEAVARGVALRLEGGLRDDSEIASEQTSDPIPEAILLAPSLDSCGSEVAIRVALGGKGAVAFRHADTGDLWLFCPRGPGPLSVVAAGHAEDEWWAASPLPYTVYLARLREALLGHGLELCSEPAQPPEEHPRGS